MKTRSLALAFLALMALALTAAGQKDKQKQKPAVYKTPQEVFDAAEKAEARDDFKTLVHCYTPRSQQKLALMLGAWFGYGRSQLKDKSDEKTKKELEEAKPVFDALDRHGLTVEAVEKIKKDAGKDDEKAEKAFLALIKDPAAFLIDVAAAAKKVGAFPKSPDKTEKKLTDVKIDGDKATGTVTVTTTRPAKDKEKERKTERKQTMTFEKVKGGWRIDEENKREEKKDKDKGKDKK
jgi:hypothetical protein